MSTKFTYSRRATATEAAAIRAKRAKRNAAPALSESALNAAIAEQIAALPKAADGAPGLNGDSAWTPVLAVVEDGERRVIAITWTGGDGNPPVSGFLGPVGVVHDIADATDVRGAAGARGKPGADGKDGAALFTESRAPKASEGANGDCWLNTKTGDFFAKADGKWKLKGNLQGPRGFAGIAGRDGGGTIISGGGDEGSSIIVQSGPPPEGGVVGQEILVGSGPPS